LSHRATVFQCREVDIMSKSLIGYNRSNKWGKTNMPF